MDRVASSSSRSWAIGGIVGPVGFVSAWVAGGLQSDDLSPVHDAISRLAAVGASTRPMMTGGFVTFGLAVPAFAVALRRHLPGPAWISAVATGVCTLGVACFPLDRSDVLDRAHAAAAGLGYITLAGVPALAARALRATGDTRDAAVAATVAALASGALVVSLSPAPTGLFQRLGLTIVDAWIVVTAVAMLRRGRSAADRSGIRRGP